MADSIPSADSGPLICKVCGMPSAFFEETDVLRKYPVQYFRCDRCGFIQTEAPYWLEEAYSSAIAMQDVGIMQRNLVNCEVTSAVLNLLFPQISGSVDFGGGHGVFVRRTSCLSRRRCSGSGAVTEPKYMETPCWTTRYCSRI